jgi:hypothetical protein
MNADRPRSFHFATAAQWRSCLFVQADTRALGSHGLRPFAAFERHATRLESDGAHAPAATREGDLLWRDDRGALHRLTACDEGTNR